MRFPINEAYYQLVNESPVSLAEKLNPKGFSRHADQLLMVCNPRLPRMANCRYYQAHGKLNQTQRESLLQKAKSLGLPVFPALNIDLYFLSKYAYKTSIRMGNYIIELKIKPSGNIRIMDRSESHRVWLKTGKDSSKVTIKVFEETFFSKWKASVISAPPKGVMFKLEREGGHGEQLELQGAIKKSEHNNGFEASLYPLHSDHIFHIRPIDFGGDFGFKVEITGQWKDWEEDDFEFPEQIVYFSDVYSDSSVISEHAIHHVSIASPAATAATAGMSMMLGIIWRWYVALPIGEEIIAALIIAAAVG